MRCGLPPDPRLTRPRSCLIAGLSRPRPGNGAFRAPPNFRAFPASAPAPWIRGFPAPGPDRMRGFLGPGPASSPPGGPTLRPPACAAREEPPDNDVPEANLDDLPHGQRGLSPPRLRPTYRPVRPDGRNKAVPETLAFKDAALLTPAGPPQDNSGTAGASVGRPAAAGAPPLARRLLALPRSRAPWTRPPAPFRPQPPPRRRDPPPSAANPAPRPGAAGVPGGGAYFAEAPRRAPRRPGRAARAGRAT
jgi:hypothetical protein